MLLGILLILFLPSPGSLQRVNLPGRAPCDIEEINVGEEVIGRPAIVYKYVTKNTVLTFDVGAKITINNAPTLVYTTFTGYSSTLTTYSTRTIPGTCSVLPKIVPSPTSSVDWSTSALPSSNRQAIDRNHNYVSPFINSSSTTSTSITERISPTASIVHMYIFSGSSPRSIIQSVLVSRSTLTPPHSTSIRSNGVQVDTSVFTVVGNSGVKVAYTLSRFTTNNLVPSRYQHFASTLARTPFTIIDKVSTKNTLNHLTTYVVSGKASNSAIIHETNSLHALIPDVAGSIENTSIFIAFNNHMQSTSHFLIHSPPSLMSAVQVSTLFQHKEEKTSTIGPYGQVTTNQVQNGAQSSLVIHASGGSEYTHIVTKMDHNDLTSAYVVINEPFTDIMSNEIPLSTYSVTGTNSLDITKTIITANGKSQSKSYLVLNQRPLSITKQTSGSISYETMVTTMDNIGRLTTYIVINEPRFSILSIGDERYKSIMSFSTVSTDLRKLPFTYPILNQSLVSTQTAVLPDSIGKSTVTGSVSKIILYVATNRTIPSRTILAQSPSTPGTGTIGTTKTNSIIQTDYISTRHIIINSRPKMVSSGLTLQLAAYTQNFESLSYTSTAAHISSGIRLSSSISVNQALTNSLLLTITETTGLFPFTSIVSTYIGAFKVSYLLVNQPSYLHPSTLSTIAYNSGSGGSIRTVVSNSNSVTIQYIILSKPSKEQRTTLSTIIVYTSPITLTGIRSYASGRMSETSGTVNTSPFPIAAMSFAIFGSPSSNPFTSSHTFDTSYLSSNSAVPALSTILRSQGSTEYTSTIFSTVSGKPSAVVIVNRMLLARLTQTSGSVGFTITVPTTFSGKISTTYVIINEPSLSLSITTTTSIVHPSATTKSSEINMFTNTGATMTTVVEQPLKTYSYVSQTTKSTLQKGALSITEAEGQSPTVLFISSPVQAILASTQQIRTFQMDNIYYSIFNAVAMTSKTTSGLSASVTEPVTFTIETNMVVNTSDAILTTPVVVISSISPFLPKIFSTAAYSEALSSTGTSSSSTLAPSGSTTISGSPPLTSTITVINSGGLATTYLLTYDPKRALFILYRTSGSIGFTNTLVTTATDGLLHTYLAVNIPIQTSISPIVTSIPISGLAIASWPMYTQSSVTWTDTLLNSPNTGITSNSASSSTIVAATETAQDLSIDSQTMEPTNPTDILLQSMAGISQDINVLLSQLVNTQGPTTFSTFESSGEKPSYNPMYPPTTTSFPTSQTSYPSEFSKSSINTDYSGMPTNFSTVNSTVIGVSISTQSIDSANLVSTSSDSENGNISTLSDTLNYLSKALSTSTETTELTMYLGSVVTVVVSPWATTLTINNATLETSSATLATFDSGGYTNSIVISQTINMLSTHIIPSGLSFSLSNTFQTSTIAPFISDITSSGINYISSSYVLPTSSDNFLTTSSVNFTTIEINTGNTNTGIFTSQFEVSTTDGYNDTISYTTSGTSATVISSSIVTSYAIHSGSATQTLVNTPATLPSNLSTTPDNTTSIISTSFPLSIQAPLISTTVESTSSLIVTSSISTAGIESTPEPIGQSIDSVVMGLLTLSSWTTSITTSSAGLNNTVTINSPSETTPYALIQSTVAALSTPIPVPESSQQLSTQLSSSSTYIANTANTTTAVGTYIPYSETLSSSINQASDSLMFTSIISAIGPGETLTPYGFDSSSWSNAATSSMTQGSVILTSASTTINTLENMQSVTIMTQLSGSVTFTNTITSTPSDNYLTTSVFTNAPTLPIVTQISGSIEFNSLVTTTDKDSALVTYFVNNVPILATVTQISGLAAFTSTMTSVNTDGAVITYVLNNIPAPINILTSRTISFTSAIASTVANDVATTYTVNNTSVVYTVLQMSGPIGFTSILTTSSTNGLAITYVLVNIPALAITTQASSSNTFTTPTTSLQVSTVITIISSYNIPGEASISQVSGTVSPSTSTITTTGTVGTSTWILINTTGPTILSQTFDSSAYTSTMLTFTSASLSTITQTSGSNTSTGTITGTGVGGVLSTYVVVNIPTVILSTIMRTSGTFGYTSLVTSNSGGLASTFILVNQPVISTATSTVTPGASAVSTIASTTFQNGSSIIYSSTGATTTALTATITTATQTSGSQVVTTIPTTLSINSISSSYTPVTSLVIPLATITQTSGSAGFTTILPTTGINGAITSYAVINVPLSTVTKISGYTPFTSTVTTTSGGITSRYVLINSPLPTITQTSGSILFTSTIVGIFAGVTSTYVRVNQPVPIPTTITVTSGSVGFTSSIATTINNLATTVVIVDRPVANCTGSANFVPSACNFLSSAGSGLVSSTLYNVQITACVAAVTILNSVAAVTCLASNIIGSLSGISIFQCLNNRLTKCNCITSLPSMCTSLSTTIAIVNSAQALLCQTTLGLFAVGEASVCFTTNALNTLTGTNFVDCLSQHIQTCPTS